MPGHSVSQIREMYADLSRRRSRGEIDQAQFVAECHKLQAQDQDGVWWTVDPRTGSYLRYDGARWAPATPPLTPAPTPTARAGIKPEAGGTKVEGQAGPKARRFLVPIAGVVVSSSCGLLWTLYSLLRIGQGERPDFMTFFIMAGLPIGLWLFRKGANRLLRPLEQYRRQFPRPLLLGVSFAIPIVLGLFLSSVSGSGYGAMRWTALFSIISAFILTRKPQVAI
jgi:hypothetical protein